MVVRVVKARFDDVCVVSTAERPAYLRDTRAILRATDGAGGIRVRLEKVREWIRCHSGMNAATASPTYDAHCVTNLAIGGIEVETLT